MIMEGLQTIAPESSFAADQQFHLVANSLAKLLDTARRELARDREAAKASLVTASDRPLVKVRPMGGARAQCPARSPQEPASTRISHERSARESPELRPFRVCES